MLHEMEGSGVKQDLIPNVRQLVFSNISLKGWTTDHDVHGLLDSASGVVNLLAKYEKIVHADAMPTCVAMVING